MSTFERDPSHCECCRAPTGRIAAMAIALTSAWFSSAALASNLVPNGSFEMPNIVSTNTFALYESGSTLIPGWTVVGGQIALLPDTYVPPWLASDGRQYVDLTGVTGFGKGIVSGLIPTVPGTQYSLSFAVGNFGAISTLGLSINGGQEVLYTNTIQPPFGQLRWMNFSTTWTATTDFAQISFIGRANGALSNVEGIGLDNVIFAPVPEPSTLLSICIGIAGIGIALHRDRFARKRRALCAEA